MAEQQQPQKEESGGTLKGWIKAVVGTVFGLLGGAAVMYITPLVDKAIKPAKPVANFEIAPEGLSVRFHNLSNADQGWWDFGDGSPLEPVKSEGEYVTHTFPQTGEYNVKLSVRNLINDESERTSTVKIGGTSTTTGTADATKSTDPKIASMVVTPLSSSYAPATFRIVSTVENAALHVWDFGDDRPLEVVTDPDEAKERIVTFNKPGDYKVRLAAVNGAKQDQKSNVITVKPPPPGMLSAVLSVTDSGTHKVKHSKSRAPFSASFPADQKGDTYEFKRPLKSMPGMSVADLVVTASNGKSMRLNGQNELALDANLLGLRGAHDLKLTLDPDKQTVWLSGKLVREGKQPPPTLMLWTELTETHDVSGNLANPPVTQMLGLPGTGMPTAQVLTLPQQPSDWSDWHRQIHFELQDAGNVIGKVDQFPAAFNATVQGRHFIVNVTRLNEQQVQVSLIDPEKVGSLR